MSGLLPDPISKVIQNPFSTTVNKGGVRGPDFPAGFIITEYVNGVPQDGQNKRSDTRLILSGSSMPMQPFPWSGEQRLSKDYYPGNPEAVVHIMGAKENDLVIHGRFKDKHYQDPKYFGVAYQFALTADALRKRGNLLKFGMHGTAGDWFRYGYLQKVDFKMNRITWIDYELTFSVVSETQPKNNYFALKDQSNPGAINSKLVAAAAAFQTNYSAVPTSMPQSLADEINSGINTVATAISTATTFVQNILDTGQSILNAANRAIGLIKNARTQVHLFQRQIGSMSTQFTALANLSAINQAIGSFSNIAHQKETAAAAMSLSAMLAQMQEQFEKISQTVPASRYKVQSGDTLQRISLKFYGTADNWEDIYTHNKLQTTALTAGAVLEIPKL